MKHAAISVAVDAVSSVRQKAKLQSVTGSGNNGGVGKASAYQFWRWVTLLMITGCLLAAAMWVMLAGFGDLIRLQQHAILLQTKDVAVYGRKDDDQCLGRRIYLYEMPPQFNEGVLRDFCLDRMLWLRMCGSYSNDGFGPKMEHVMEPIETWYMTEQFAVEVIVHKRMKTYECLTNNPDIADLFYLPYYVGLDVSQYIFSNEIQLRDLLTERFFGWLLAQPTFVRMQGHKHVLSLSRIIWDFTRQVQSMSWGNTILSSFEMQNVTKLLIERDPKNMPRDQIAIPYPSSFHPESDEEVENWQRKVASVKREFLASLAGSPRNITEQPNMKVRDVLFEQCTNSDRCTVLECRHVDCPKNPHLITNLFLSSTFCLQPPGDSPTRKAVFDCLVAGSIPVFFNPHTAYTQYFWHLPEDGSSYSVLLNNSEVSFGRVDVMEQLAQIPEEKVRSMQEVIRQRIIPSIIYSSPTRNPKRKEKDAFDLLIEHFFNPEYNSYPDLSSPDFLSQYNVA